MALPYLAEFKVDSYVEKALAVFQFHTDAFVLGYIIKVNGRRIIRAMESGKAFRPCDVKACQYVFNEHGVNILIQ